MAPENFAIITLILSKLQNFVVPMSNKSRDRSNILKFNTAIITYPSNYDGLLTIGTIVEFFSKLCKPTTKIVVAREDPDEEIQRIHYHLYWDDEVNRKQVTTKYFDIPLPEPVVVFINPDEKKTRTYQLFTDLASKLGIDDINEKEMVTKLDQYISENYEEGTMYDILKVAHPNIQLKKEYGDKYFMLKYVVKQKLVARANFNVNEELEYLQKECEKLIEKTKDLIEKNLLKQIGIETVEELIELLKKYKLKQLKKEERKSKKRGRPKSTNSILDETALKFRDWLRPLVIQSNLTKKEVIKEITNNENWWQVFSSNYINYNKLINDMFRGRPPAKPTRNYDFKFWVPNKLYDYLMWLDEWVMKWHTGQRLEHRPKGLVLIGPSRTGKTSLISCLGDFSYFKNIWSLDCWEGKTPFTVMDDMDAGDEGKGLSFCWYKPFFGSQDAITVTDKFKPKEDIYNGKPLIWLNNYPIDETFKSNIAQDYIKKNMEIVYITKPFNEKPIGMDLYTYKEFDPKCTWYYKNIILNQSKENNKNVTEIININNDLKIIDETMEIINDLEPLSIKKKRLDEEIEKGRRTKRSRTKN